MKVIPVIGTINLNLMIVDYISTETIYSIEIKDFVDFQHFEQFEGFEHF